MDIAEALRLITEDAQRPTCGHSHIVTVHDTDTGLLVMEHASSVAEAIEKAAEILTEEIGPGISFATKIVGMERDPLPGAVKEMRTMMTEMSAQTTPAKPVICGWSDVLGVVVRIIPLSGAN